MRVHAHPLPGDLVIRARQDRVGLLALTYVVTRWPDPETIIAGPYQSASYAIQKARHQKQDRSERIWRDRARGSEPERLEDVTSDR